MRRVPAKWQCDQTHVLRDATALSGDPAPAAASVAAVLELVGGRVSTLRQKCDSFERLMSNDAVLSPWMSSVLTSLSRFVVSPGFGITMSAAQVAVARNMRSAAEQLRTTYVALAEVSPYVQPALRQTQPGSQQEQQMLSLAAAADAQSARARALLRAWNLSGAPAVADVPGWIAFTVGTGPNLAWSSAMRAIVGVPPVPGVPDTGRGGVFDPLFPGGNENGKIPGWVWVVVGLAAAGVALVAAKPYLEKKVLGGAKRLAASSATKALAASE